MNTNDPTNFPAVVPATIDGEMIQTVSGRDLHNYLGVGRLFAAWLPDRIDQYGFVENVDFVVFSETGNNPDDRFPVSESKARGGHNRKEYALSLDMAKELAMVERNDRGKQARRYFIECERRAKARSTAIANIARPNLNAVRETRLVQAMYARIAKMAGLTGNQAALAVSRGTMALTGIDPLALMGHTHLDAPQNEALLSPTTIAKELGMSAQKLNLLLCDMGLQRSFRDAKNKIQYEPTEAGKEAGGVMQDTGKRHSNGAPVRQLRWLSSILRHLEDSNGARH